MHQEVFLISQRKTCVDYCPFLQTSHVSRAHFQNTTTKFNHFDGLMFYSERLSILSCLNGDRVTTSAVHNARKVCIAPKMGKSKADAIKLASATDTSGDQTRSTYFPAIDLQFPTKGLRCTFSRMAPSTYKLIPNKFSPLYRFSPSGCQFRYDRSH